MGASILISAAPRLNLISSDKETILLTFTPGAGVSSYLVTAGPFEQLSGSIETSTPKVESVSLSLLAVSIMSSLLFFDDLLPLLKSVTGGNL